ncbi:MAG TPA: TadE family protein, partial [Acidimicrobiales bacterium]|nr:TadE family protein [Acidimicrobiales bacterium]
MARAEGRGKVECKEQGASICESVDATGAFDEHQGGWSMQAARSRRKRSEGQSLAEFALVFPIFVLVLAGILDFGMGLFSYMTMLNATREGARLASTNCTMNLCSGAVQAR